MGTGTLLPAQGLMFRPETNNYTDTKIKKNFDTLMSHLNEYACRTVAPGSIYRVKIYTLELKWLEHLWDHENQFETGVVRANEG